MCSIRVFRSHVGFMCKNLPIKDKPCYFKRVILINTTSKILNIMLKMPSPVVAFVEFIVSRLTGSE